MENYELAKDKVENTKQSYRAIAKEHDVSHTKLIQIAKQDGWNISHRVSKKVSKSSNNSTKKRTEKPAHEKVLGKIAIRKMIELKDELGNKYSNVDEPLIVMYAKNYERYLELEQELNTRGILSKSVKTGTEYMSPNFTAMLALQKSLVSIAQQLGLSIAARKKIGLDLGKEDEGQTTIYDIIESVNKSSENEEDQDGIL
ncbi:P27 family phage terminase small subunit [Arcobacter roscoffensis]|uniref:P27 family phage terminase small subunit n=1 Tax=Arcobacter roscoffensis TaxID=2961520 RepID=A0ABY5E109_9BACT|nr:P27 family phage terminase small subunit [Arcobacter roscoffensis]UTJ05400.1 P27 family phage terminase small subunit [Arcobacter roscoffensis]